MLVIPKMDPGRWNKIKGTDNCVGRDVGIVKVFEMNSPSRAGTCKWTSREKVFPGVREAALTQDDCWILYANIGYIMVLDYIEIPEDCYGILRPRSTLLKMGIVCSQGAVWDPGYKGNGKVVVYPTYNTMIERGLQVFSLELHREEGMTIYNGSYQGERV